jgi:hypothetical protein
LHVSLSLTNYKLSYILIPNSLIAFHLVRTIISSDDEIILTFTSITSSYI